MYWEDETGRVETRVEKIKLSPFLYLSAFEDGVSPVGGKAKAVNLGGGQGYNTAKLACRSCRNFMG